MKLLGIISGVALFFLIKSLFKKSKTYQITGFVPKGMDDIFIKDTEKNKHIGWINIQTGSGRRR